MSAHAFPRSCVCLDALLDTISIRAYEAQRSQKARARGNCVSEQKSRNRK